MTYRTGRHWGVTIVCEPARCCDLHTRHCEAPADLCCPSCAEAAHVGLTPHADGSRCVLDPDGAQLVAVAMRGTIHTADDHTADRLSGFVADKGPSGAWTDAELAAAACDYLNQEGPTP